MNRNDAAGPAPDPAPSPAPYPAFSGYGIEIEYMIVDRESLDIRPLADELLQSLAGAAAAEIERGEMGWSNELTRHVLEIKNLRPAADLGKLAAAFQAEVRTANAQLQAAQARLLPGGMHPWMDPVRETRLWQREPAAIYRAYERIFDCRQHGWANIQSQHLNLPFADDLEFARLHAAVRLALPLLPALAASSPFAEGSATGFLDTRMEVYGSHQMRIPASMGELIPDPAASRADYQARVLEPMYRQAAPYDPQGVLRHEWFNARAAIPRFARNAVEIRVLDTQECLTADFAVAAAASALVRRLYAAGAAWLEREGAMATSALARLLRACIRDAEAAVIDDARYLALLGLPQRALAAGEVWRRLIAEMLAAGEIEPLWSAPLRRILDQGPLARRLLAAAGRFPSQHRLRAIYDELGHCLQEGRMYPP